jgi:hypothetical protein
MNIPRKFYNENDKEFPVIAYTVKELIEKLKELPGDLKVNHTFGDGVQLIVYNIEEEKYICLAFEEII